MKKFLINIILFSSILVTAYLVYFKSIDSALKNSEYIDCKEWNEVFSSNINADLLIIGSSRARKMINPLIIDTILNLDSYNLGMEGYKLPFQDVKYSIYARNNKKEKITIQIVDHFSFQKRDDLYNSEQFLPYMDDSALVEQMRRYDGFSWSNYNLPFWRYYGQSNSIMAATAEILGLKKFKSEGYKGYYPKKNPAWEKDFDIEKANNPNGKTIQINNIVYENFKESIENREIDSIYHFIVYAPEYIEFHDFIRNRDSIANLYYQASLLSETCFFIDYKDSLISKNKEFFYNPTHLNQKGSQSLSISIANYIKNLSIDY
ncbi:MAG: hypothetical protein AB8B74_01855 [Crocinitomicaceae bacterium]